jgi:hypothetical protein
VPGTRVMDGPDLDMRVGDHVCAFYWGVAGRDQVLIPFLRSGLRAGDNCICVVHATEPDAVLAAVDSKEVVDAFVASQQLAVRTAMESYLQHGYFSTTEMIDYYEALVRVATENGHTARVAGEGTWASEGVPGSDELLDYESARNDFVRRYPQMILCLYDIADLDGGLIIDLMKTHPKLVFNGMVVDNPHYLTPAEYRAQRASALPV